MTTVGMNYDVLPGKEDQFETAFANVLQLMQTLPGHIHSRLYRDVRSAGSYLIMSQWESRSAFADFLKSEAFRSTVAWGKAEILRGRPSHRVYGDEG